MPRQRLHVWKMGGIRMSSIYWLICFIVMIGIELGTLALTTIWFAGGALAAFFLSLSGAGIEAQLLVFVAVSFLLLFFTRPWAARYLNRRTVKTNAESLVGRTARITEEVNNRLGTGTAVVNGQEWTARALDDAAVYPEGTLTVIREIRGVKLMVEVEKEKEQEVM